MPATENYRNTHIMTASPMELILMLYDEAIRSLGNAEEAFKVEGPDHLQEINNNILHAENIITELTVSLDMEQGGEIAANLQRLYDFMTNHLAKANVEKNIKPITEVKELMSELRETWGQVAEKEPAREDSLPIGTEPILAAG